jgi:MFS family permease
MRTWLYRNVNASNHRFFAWAVTLTAGLLFFYEFFQLNSMNVLSTPLMRDFHLTGTQLSHLSICYFISNASLVFFAGNLLDRHPARYVTLFATTVCILGIALFASSHSLTGLMVARFLIGIGGAFCFISGMKVASRWFEPKQLALATGVLVTMAMLGGMLAQAPLTALIQHLGWRHALWVDAAVGCGILLLMLLLIHDNPHHPTCAKSQKAQLKEEGLMHNIMLALRNPQNWLAAVYTCTLNLPIFILGALWGSLFLQQSLHFSALQAASLCGLIYTGTLVGSPLAGALSDRLQRRKIPMIVGSLLSLAVVACILDLHGLHYGTLAFLFFMLGFVTSAQVISYPFVAEHNKGSITATAVSIVSMITICGGAVFQPLFAYLIGLHWNHQYVHGVAFYTAHDYSRALLILPAVFVVSLLCALFMKEKKPRTVTQ